MTGEHYVRANGRLISPCKACQLVRQADLHREIREDPVRLNKLREKWAYYKAVERRKRPQKTAKPFPAQTPVDLDEPVQGLPPRRMGRRRRSTPPQDDKPAA